MNDTGQNLGPLKNGQTVAIIGGGPGGIATALTLQREAVRQGRQLVIELFEGKHFDRDYNQCTGVLSPPLISLLHDELDIHLPDALILRAIRGYELHTAQNSLLLEDEVPEQASLAVRRSAFDQYMADCARTRGIAIHQTRVTDLEFRPDGVLVFTWSGTWHADVVVGAFGLSRAMTATLSRQTAYRPPRVMDTLVTKLHFPDKRAVLIPDLLDDRIHVFLPSLPRVDFCALIPKGNHVTAIVAGRDVRSGDMDAALAHPVITRLLPESRQPIDYFKGRFPTSLARGMYGNRYVTVGDAAGLVRPFKGKGINSAIISGILAARTMLKEGISAEAFTAFFQGCREITGDLLFGNLVRTLAWTASHHLTMEPVLRRAAIDHDLQRLLYACVSGCESYRQIVCRPGTLSLALRLGAASVWERLRTMR